RHAVDGPVDEDLLGAAPTAPDLDPDGAPVSVGIAPASAAGPAREARQQRRDDRDPAEQPDARGTPLPERRGDPHRRPAEPREGVDQQRGLPGAGPVAVEPADRGGEPHQLPAAPGPVPGPGAVTPLEGGAPRRAV